MTELSIASSTDTIKDAIASQIADFANRTAELLERGKEGVLGDSQLPLLKLIQLLGSGATRAASAFVKKNYPWVSPTDVSLGCYAAGGSSSSRKALTPILEQIEGSLEAIAEVSVGLASGENDNSLFFRVLQRLDPYALNELEKYLRWQLSQAKPRTALSKELNTKLEVLSEAWKLCCMQHGVSVLAKEATGVSWKALFISTYFQSQCLSFQAEFGRDTVPALALFLDNRDLLEESGALDLLT